MHNLDKFKNHTISSLQNGLINKTFTCCEITQYYLNQLKNDDKCLITINNDAIKIAKKVDEKISSGENLLPLEGVPFVLKDNISTKGVKTTCASKILESYIPNFNAFVYDLIIKQNGILLGKVNLDEFAMGSTCENSAFFITPNPIDDKYVSGGSSGGCGYAVAKDMCVYALGSDAGGSGRLPAAFCNIYGFKPTYGTVSRFGLVEYASSFDQISPMAKCSEDCFKVFENISKKDENDETCVGFKKHENNNSLNKALKIGIVSSFEKYCSDEVKNHFNNEVEIIKKSSSNLNFNLIKENIFADILDCYYTISLGQCYSNLARYRCFLSEKQKDFYEDFDEQSNGDREGGFGKEVKKRINSGGEILSKGFYEKQFEKALNQQNKIKELLKNIFNENDLIICPTSPFNVPKIGELDKEQSRCLDVFTVIANIAEIPAISIPLNNKNDIYCGFQIMADKFCEEKIFNFIKSLNL